MYQAYGVVSMLTELNTEYVAYGGCQTTEETLLRDEKDAWNNTDHMENVIVKVVDAVLVKWDE